VASLLSAPLYLFAPATENPPVFSIAFAKAFGGTGNMEGAAAASSGDTSSDAAALGALRPLLLLVGAAVAYQLEYALNFVFVALVDPVSAAHSPGAQ